MNLAKEIQKLKKDVMGHYGEIATEAGVTRQAVAQVLSGEYNNDNVIQAAIKVRDSLRKKREQLFNKLKSTK